MSRRLTFSVLAAALFGWLLATFYGDPAWAQAAEPTGFYAFVQFLKSLFLSALKAVIVPVIFFSLLGGVLGLGEATRMRTLGLTTIAYFTVSMMLAAGLGLTVISYFHPWTALDVTQIAKVEVPEGRLIDPASGSIADLLTTLVGQCLTNPFSALVEMNILGIVTNAVLIGLAVLLVTPEDSPVRTGIDHLGKVFFRILGWFLWLMPVGVFAVVFELTLKQQDLLDKLLPFMGLVFATTAFHGLVVLPALAWFIGGMSPLRLMRGIARPMLVAFTTSSSNATLPVSMKAAEEDLGVPRNINSFVLPLGATVNMDGTALFEGMAAVFLANLYGIEMTSTGMTAIFIMAMVSSIGAPGVPSGSMAAMQMVLLAVGIPLEAIGILLLIERPMDTFRTAVNVEGDLVGCVIVQKVLGHPS